MKVESILSNFRHLNLGIESEQVIFISVINEERYRLPEGDSSYPKMSV